MTTLKAARDYLIKDIYTAMGPQGALGETLEQAVDLFVGFLEEKGLKYTQDINPNILGVYRVYLRTFSEGENEKGLVEAANVYLLMAAKNGWIDKAICEFFSVISPAAYFSKPIKNDLLN
jgi:hypothetical protein